MQTLLPFADDHIRRKHVLSATLKRGNIIARSLGLIPNDYHATASAFFDEQTYRTCKTAVDTYLRKTDPIYHWTARKDDADDQTIICKVNAPIGIIYDSTGDKTMTCKTQFVKAVIKTPEQGGMPIVASMYPEITPNTPLQQCTELSSLIQTSEFRRIVHDNPNEAIAIASRLMHNIPTLTTNNERQVVATDFIYDYEDTKHRIEIDTTRLAHRDTQRHRTPYQSDDSFWSIPAVQPNFKSWIILSNITRLANIDVTNQRVNQQSFAPTHAYTPMRQRTDQFSL